jgi:TetR/AcrR family transcriptional regulator, cholesterol catabolism regulator
MSTGTAAVRNTREDVVRAAGRLFAERGYHGTSMRDLGRELGLMGSSLYSHIGSKEELLVEVVERGAALFQAAADAALADPGGPEELLRALVAGHVDVVLDHRDEVRTFLYEADALPGPQRARVIEARDRYERAFRDVIRLGVETGTFRPGLDPRLAAIFVLSILNAIERWYRPDGAIDRNGLVGEVDRFVAGGIGGGKRARG